MEVVVVVVVVDEEVAEDQVRRPGADAVAAVVAEAAALGK